MPARAGRSRLMPGWSPQRKLNISTRRRPVWLVRYQAGHSVCGCCAVDAGIFQVMPSRTRRPRSSTAGGWRRWAAVRAEKFRAGFRHVDAIADPLVHAAKPAASASSWEALQNAKVGRLGARESARRKRDRGDCGERAERALTQRASSSWFDPVVAARRLRWPRREASAAASKRWTRRPPIADAPRRRRSQLTALSGDRKTNMRAGRPHRGGSDARRR